MIFTSLNGTEPAQAVLDGLRGSFVLHHTGSMTPSAGQSLAVQVAPESGTGALVGLSGTLAIEIAADGQHFYTFDYALPDAPAGDG